MQDTISITILAHYIVTIDTVKGWFNLQVQKPKIRCSLWNKAFRKPRKASKPPLLRPKYQSTTLLATLRHIHITTCTTLLLMGLLLFPIVSFLCIKFTRFMSFFRSMLLLTKCISFASTDAGDIFRCFAWLGQGTNKEVTIKFARARSDNGKGNYGRLRGPKLVMTSVYRCKKCKVD